MNLLIASLYLEFASQAKDEIELYNYNYQTKKPKTKRLNDKQKRLRYL